MGEYHDFTPEDAWATITFYDLWGVPKTTLDGYPEYDSSHAPSKIKVYQTKSGDYCAFYNGKFYAYYFGMKGSNHAEYLNTLSSKYGNPISHTAGFLRYTIYGKLPCDFMYSSWVNGGTRVVLAKNVYKGTGMIYTAAYNFYISQSITKEIRDYVSSSVERLEAKKRDKQKAAKQADMSKLQ